MSADREHERGHDLPPPPADVVACAAFGCTRTDDLRRVELEDGDMRVFCPTHTKHALGVSS